jgi:hypothetical protein
MYGFKGFKKGLRPVDFELKARLIPARTRSRLTRESGARLRNRKPV